MTDKNSDAPLYDNRKVREGIAKCVEVFEDEGMNLLESYQAVCALKASLKAVIGRDAQRAAGSDAQGGLAVESAVALDGADGVGDVELLAVVGADDHLDDAEDYGNGDGEHEPEHHEEVERTV